MSKNIEELSCIKDATGACVLMKNGQRKAVVEVLLSRTPEVFDSLIEHFGELDCLIVKMPCTYRRFTEYFETMVSASFGKNYVPELLLYIQEFKRLIPRLNYYARFLVIPTDTLQSVLFALDRLDVVYRLCDGIEYKDILDNLFSHA